MNVRRLTTSNLGVFRAFSHGFKNPSNTSAKRPLSFSSRRLFPRHDQHGHRQDHHWPNNGRPVQPSFTDEVVMPSLIRPTLFAVGVSGLAYYAAGTATNRDTQFWAEKLGAGQWWRGLTVPGSPELQRARLLDLKFRLTETLTSLRDNTSMLPGAIRQFVNRGAYIVANNWLSAGEGRRTTMMIASLCATIFVAWQIPVLRSFMNRHFLHDPLSGRFHTMATSIFSHSALMHLAFNSLALVSFGTAMSSVLKKQQASAPSGMPESTSMYHFLAFFLSAGLFSSYVSHIVSTRIRLPILLRTLLSSSAKADITPAAAASMSIAPSLGASGAIYATVTASALAFPDANVSLIFLPFVSLPIGAGVGAMVCLDVVGIIRGWRMFDHWAHLGGAVFGVAYYNYGTNFWDWVRRHAPGSHPVPLERTPPSSYTK